MDDFLSLNSKIKENRNASEIIKTVNMLVSSMNSEYLWEYMTRRFCTSLRYGKNGSRLRCLMLTFITIMSQAVKVIVNSLSLP